ncbi:unnamed protein product, partial [Rotaria sp. Silwood1]
MVNTQENKEIITIVWYDSNIHSYNARKNIDERLRQLNEYVEYYDDIESCMNYIQSIDNEKLFLITSSIGASQIHSFPQITSIFIFDFDESLKDELGCQYLKCIDRYTELEDLYLSIQEQLEFQDELSLKCSFFDQYEYSQQILSKQTSDLFWYQFVNKIILEIPDDSKAKNELIDSCCQYYQNNLKLIDKFKHEYHSNEVIQWYLTKSFPYKMIKKALQIKDFDQLNSLRYFMKDLIQNFEKQHQNSIQNKQKLIVYRGIKLSTEQLDEFKNNEGKLVLFHEFLKGTRHRSKALNFLKRSTKQTNLVDVILEIESYPQDFYNSIILIDINEQNEFSSQEDILFNLNVL